MGKKTKKEYIEYEDGTRVELGPDDSPEWTEEDFRNAKSGIEALEEVFGKEGAKEVLAGNITMKPVGRPPVENPKKSISIRLDSDLLEALRAKGRGWQTMVNRVLRQHLKLDTN